MTDEEFRHLRDGHDHLFRAINILRGVLPMTAYVQKMIGDLLQIDCDVVTIIEEERKRRQ